jgi:hypothetical protein
MTVPNRLNELKNQTELTGLNFVFVSDAKFDGTGFLVNLHLYFYPTQKKTQTRTIVKKPKQILGPGPLDNKKIIIQSVVDKNSPKVKIKGNKWEKDYLKIIVYLTPNNAFGEYDLKIDHPDIDYYFNTVQFNFQAGCEFDVDCKPDSALDAKDAQKDYPVDYLARDFYSFRQALLEFANLKYPEWEDRSEADVGIMLIEVMSALGDELAYYQDCIGREAHLETASMRRSVRRHARLVDYSMHGGLAASTLLCLQAKKDDDINAGAKVCNADRSVVFEIGCRIKETMEGKSYPIKKGRNELSPYTWDEDDVWLTAGSNYLFLKGRQKSLLSKGDWLILEENIDTPSHTRHPIAVQLNKKPTLQKDKLLKKWCTRIEWHQHQAQNEDINLKGLKIRGNILPATAGKTFSKYFSAGALPGNYPSKIDGKNIFRAVEREGPNGNIIYLFSLKETENNRLAFLEEDFGGDNPRAARAEVDLKEMEYKNNAWDEKTTLKWEWRRSFFGDEFSQPSSSQSTDPHFTLDDGIYKKVVTYNHEGKEIIHTDLASGKGYTLRFGDGEFGMQPKEGAVFKVTYRVIQEGDSNVNQNTLVQFDSQYDDLIESIRNPFPVSNDIEAETVEEVKHKAPYAYQLEAFRAVTRDDYARAAEKLEWVQRAGAAFRWTGSWLSAFVTADPLGAIHIDDNQKKQLTAILDRYRQSGREVCVKDPTYADLDIEIDICAEADAYPNEVKERVVIALAGDENKGSGSGFFAPDNFTFGSSLRLGDLESRIKSVEGVKAVKSIKIGRRGWHEPRIMTDLTYDVEMNEIIRVENDPRNPDRGSLTINAKNGA